MFDGKKGRGEEIPPLVRRLTGERSREMDANAPRSLPKCWMTKVPLPPTPKSEAEANEMEAAARRPTLLDSLFVVA